MNAFLDMLNWILLFITLSGMALMLRELSRRLGDALRTKKFYFLYDAGVAVLAVAVAIMLLSYPEGSLSLLARLIFFGGAALIAGTTARYWGWIIPEIFMRGK
ncbi:hypothetical protein MCP_2526 [Methanocella paludicola SANAE]|uniref:Uncharacterized protein n=1 Tax=Methanocella paludicola (strain DSM 17711 / JCM 13418 / NBRC 101707 / SANAE) TaxID=304371 RepID=D1Z1M6_METPS|nr:hypothetical protein [Methanocella paludicola]BAI62598.1 hypothetical protein MCP_2526 [Methanocella paludicola SANAE]